jgi:hypothetical protein
MFRWITPGEIEVCRPAFRQASSRGGGHRLAPDREVGTSVAAFVGLASTEPLNKPTLVTDWSQCVASFGEFTDGYYLAHSLTPSEVLGF